MLLGDAVAITQLLLNYRLICQLLLTECVDDGDSPSTRLISSGDPCRIQERPRNIKLEDMYFLLFQRHMVITPLFRASFQRYNATFHLLPLNRKHILSYQTTIGLATTLIVVRALSNALSVLYQRHVSSLSLSTLDAYHISSYLGRYRVALYSYRASNRALMER